jgi:hypothetical protein
VAAATAAAGRGLSLDVEQATADRELEVPLDAPPVLPSRFLELPRGGVEVLPLPEFAEDQEGAGAAELGG